MKEKKETKEFIKIQDLKEEVVGIIAYKDGFIVATKKGGIYTNVKSLLKSNSPHK